LHICFKIKCMYSLRNKVQLIGNLGGDPDIRTLESGRKMARFSLATHEMYRDSNGERVNETLWHNVVAWGRTAEIVERYLSKGAEAAVEGKLVTRSYTDKEGIKKYITEVHANELLVMSSSNAQKQAENGSVLPAP
jgi:single-strand DNA-binding protein